MTEYILSEKTGQSINRVLQKIESRTFTEDDIKLLMLDVRELGREIDTSAPTDNRFAGPFHPFVQIADSVAHTNRDRGGLKKRLADYVQDSIAHLRKFATLDEFIAAGGKLKAVGALDCHQAALAMLALATMYLQRLGIPDRPGVIRLPPYIVWEISLCFISLLQGSIFFIGNDSIAIFRIVVHRGIYRLYANLYDAELKNEMRRLLVRVDSGASVVVATTRCIDVDHVAARSDLMFMTRSRDDPYHILETFRDPLRRLHVRPIRLRLL